MERKKWLDLTPRQIVFLTATGALASAVLRVGVDIDADSFPAEVLSYASGFSGLELDTDLNSELIMLQLISKARNEYGLPPLVLDPKIRKVAIAHSRDMLVREFFDHTNPDGERLSERLRKGSIDFKNAGENLAKSPNVFRAHEALMESEGHRQTILEPEFTKIGIGVIAIGKPRIYLITQNFTD